MSLRSGLGDDGKLPILDAQQNWLRGFPVDVHFGVKGHARQPVLVLDRQATNIELPAAHIFACQVALYGGHTLAGEVHAAQL